MRAKVEALARYEEFSAKQGRRPIAKNRSIDIGEAPEINRAGYNRLRNYADYQDKRNHLMDLLNNSSIPDSDKQVIKDRIHELDQAARNIRESEDYIEESTHS
jgi:hypothetical protein